MNIRLIKKLKLNLLKRKIENMNEKEKENINKIINFAITWWLKDINITWWLKDVSTENSKDNMMYRTISQLSEEQLASLENFKHLMGMTILKKLLVSEDPVILYRDYTTSNATFARILQESNCQNLDVLLPINCYMTIYKERIWINKGGEVLSQLAFDVHQKYDFDNSSVQITDDQASTQRIDDINLGTLPRNFISSNYDFLSMYVEEQNTNKANTKRYTR